MIKHPKGMIPHRVTPEGELQYWHDFDECWTYDIDCRTEACARRLGNTFVTYVSTWAEPIEVTA